MSRRLLAALFALWMLPGSLWAQEEAQDNKEPSLSEKILSEQPEKRVPRYALGSVARSFGLTVAAYGMAAGGGALFFFVDQKCDDVGALASVGCQVFVFPFTGLIGAAGLGAAALAPSAGQYAAGEKLHARITSGVRLGGAALVGLGALEFAKTGELDGKARNLIIAGSIPLVGLGLYDIIDAGLAPKRVAKRARKKEAATLSLHPAPLVAPGGQVTMGLFAAGTF